MVLALGAKSAKSLLKPNPLFSSIFNDSTKLVISSQEFILESGYIKALKFIKN